jgi:hypothetical protein
LAPIRALSRLLGPRRAAVCGSPLLPRCFQAEPLRLIPGSHELRAICLRTPGQPSPAVLPRISTLQAIRAERQGDPDGRSWTRTRDLLISSGEPLRVFADVGISACLSRFRRFGAGSRRADFSGLRGPDVAHPLPTAECDRSGVSSVTVRRRLECCEADVRGRARNAGAQELRRSSGRFTTNEPRR